MLEAGLRSSPRAFAITTRRALGAILLAGVALRVVSALYQGNAVTDLPGVFDQISYDELARRVAQGYGFTFATGHWPATRAGEPTAHWSFLYTLYLTAVYVVSGFQPLVARIVQAVVVGMLQPWLTYRIGRRVFGESAGMLAAFFSALYIYFFYYAGSLVTEAFYIVGVLWTIDAALRLAGVGHVLTGKEAARAPSWGRWLELGLAIGVTVLLRQVFLAFVPFLCVWLWWVIPAGRGVATRRSIIALARLPTLKGLVVAMLVVVGLVVPWTFRNLQAFGSFVPLNTNAGFAFFWGNHPIYGTQFVPLLPSDGPGYGDLIPAELRQLNEADLDRALLGRGLGFVVADPGRYALLSLSRAQEYFKFWPAAGSDLISNVSRVGSFGVALPFMLYGLWLSLRALGRSRDAGQRSAVVLLLLFVVVYSTVHLLSWALIRYRLPVDAVLVVFAAHGVVDLGRRLFRDSEERPEMRGVGSS